MPPGFAHPLLASLTIWGGGVTYGQMDTRTDGLTHRWMQGWTDGRTEGRMDSNTE